jgi:hypothetical protein
MTGLLVIGYSCGALGLALLFIAWYPSLKVLIYQIQTKPIRRTEVARELPRDWIG